MESAIERGADDEIRRLLDEGADPDRIRIDGSSLLDFALRLRRWGVAALLLERGARVGGALSQGKDAAWTSFLDWTAADLARDGSMTLAPADLERLLDFFAGLGCRLSEEPTERALRLLLFRSPDHVDAAKALLQRGLPAPPGVLGLAAATVDQEDLIALLLERGADPNERTPTDILAAAAGEATPGRMRLFLERGLDPNVSVDGAGTVMHWLAADGDLEFLTLALDRGGSVDALDIDDRTPLHLAADRGFADGCRLLLERGADPTKKDHAGQTAMDYLAGGDAAIAELFMARGAEPNPFQAAAFGMTARIEAAVEHDPDLLFDPGPDGETLLDAAAFGLQIETARRIVTLGHPLTLAGAVVLDAIDEIPRLLSRHRLGETTGVWAECEESPLEFAAARGSAAIVRNLLDLGEVPTPRALRNSVERADGATVARLLLDAGADPVAKDTSGRIPADYARAALPCPERDAVLRLFDRRPGAERAR